MTSKYPACNFLNCFLNLGIIDFLKASIVISVEIDIDWGDKPDLSSKFFNKFLTDSLSRTGLKGGIPSYRSSFISITGGLLFRMRSSGPEI